MKTGEFVLKGIRKLKYTDFIYTAFIKTDFDKIFYY